MKATAAPAPSRHGFTLVELLVVIGIIAMLISILLPTLGKARKSAQEAMCMNNLRQWGQGFAMYAAQNKQLLPSDGGANDGDVTGAPLLGPETPVGLGWESPACWWNAIPNLLSRKTYDSMQVEYANGAQSALPGADNQSLFTCPSAGPASGVKTDVVQDGRFIMYGRVGTTASVARPTYMCYAFNSKLMASTAYGTKITQIHNSASTVLMLEKRMSGGEVTTVDDAYYQTQGGAAGRLTSRTLARIRGDWQRFTTRHRKDRGGFLLFVDGHVGFLSMHDALTAGSTGNMNKPSVALWTISGPAAP